MCEPHHIACPKKELGLSVGPRARGQQRLRPWVCATTQHLTGFPHMRRDTTHTTRFRTICQHTQPEHLNPSRQHRMCCTLSLTWYNPMDPDSSPLPIPISSRSHGHYHPKVHTGSSACCKVMQTVIAVVHHIWLIYLIHLISIRRYRMSHLIHLNRTCTRQIQIWCHTSRTYASVAISIHPSGSGATAIKGKAGVGFANQGDGSC